MADPQFVTIPLEEYASLKEDRDWLDCLESAGVDNWDGYSFAREIQRQREKGEDV